MTMNPLESIGPNWIPRLSAFIIGVGLLVPALPIEHSEKWSVFVIGVGAALGNAFSRQWNVSSERSLGKPEDPAAAAGAGTVLKIAIAGLMVGALLLSSGCARIVGQTETRADGTSITRFRGYTLFDSHNELTKLAITQTTTNKLNQKFGLGSMTQESSASNVVSLLAIGADGALRILKP